MPSKIAPSLIKQKLADVISVDSSTKKPLSLSNFLKLATDIIKQIRERHERLEEFHLSPQYIHVTYNIQSQRYENVKVHRPHHPKVFSYNNNHDVYQIAPFLEDLFAVTDSKPTTNLGRLINIIVTHELISFSENSFHYRDKKLTESLEILYTVMLATTELLQFPSNKLENLDIDAIENSRHISKTIGGFMQDKENYSHFDKKLTEFFNGMLILTNDVEYFSSEDNADSRLKASSIRASTSTPTPTLNLSDTSSNPRQSPLTTPRELNDSPKNFRPFTSVASFFYTQATKAFESIKFNKIAPLTS